jgi:hypothetical protein
VCKCAAEATLTQQTQQESERVAEIETAGTTGSRDHADKNGIPSLPESFIGLDRMLKHRPQQDAQHTEKTTERTAVSKQEEYERSEEVTQARGRDFPRLNSDDVSKDATLTTDKRPLLSWPTAVQITTKLRKKTQNRVVADPDHERQEQLPSFSRATSSTALPQDHQDLQASTVTKRRLVRQSTFLATRAEQNQDVGGESLTTRTEMHVQLPTLSDPMFVTPSDARFVENSHKRDVSPASQIFSDLEKGQMGTLTTVTKKQKHKKKKRRVSEERGENSAVHITQET